MIQVVEGEIPSAQVKKLIVRTKKQIKNWTKLTLQIGAALFYWQLGQMLLLQTGVA